MYEIDFESMDNCYQTIKKYFHINISLYQAKLNKPQEKESKKVKSYIDSEYELINIKIEKGKGKMVNSTSNGDLTLNKKNTSCNPLASLSGQKVERKLKTDANIDEEIKKEFELDNLINRTKKLMMKTGNKANFERSIITKANHDFDYSKIPFTTINKNHSLLKYPIHHVSNIRTKLVHNENRNSSTNYRTMAEDHNRIKTSTNKDSISTVLPSESVLNIQEKFKKEYNFDYGKLHKSGKKEKNSYNIQYHKGK